MTQHCRHLANRRSLSYILGKSEVIVGVCDSSSLWLIKGIARCQRDPGGAEVRSWPAGGIVVEKLSTSVKLEHSEAYLRRGVID